jgi:putative Holliday junction resolvase
MRIMGLDYGAKTVGVAISDEMLLTAQPIETIRRERPAKLRQTLARIESLMKDYDIDKVVIGLPKKLNNEEGDRCEKTRVWRDGGEKKWS